MPWRTAPSGCCDIEGQPQDDPACSIGHYQVFRIFHEIAHFEWETGKRADIAYMVDQSHNLKGKIEAMIQTVTTAQELYAKAALVDHNRLADFQNRSELIDAENCLKDAFSTDVRPAIRDWARSRGLAEDPLKPSGRAATWNESPRSGGRRMQRLFPVTLNPSYS